jgi:signal transduction histidine kinase
MIDVRPDRLFSGRAFLEQRSVFSADVRRDDPDNAALYAGWDVRAVLAAPITAGEHRLGLLTVWSSRTPVFAESDLEMVQLVARQAAAVLESRALLQQVAEAQAREEADRLKDQLLASISHDLRNPLTAIGGTAQLLRRRLDRAGTVAPDRLRASVTSIETATGQMARLVDQLLDYARLQLDCPLELDCQPTDLVGLARRVVAAHETASDRHQLRLEATEPSLVGLWDQDRLERVLQNLLSNAIKYSPACGTVRVQIRREHVAPLSRLENAVDRHACEAVAEALVEVYIQQRQCAGTPLRLVLDLDGTDDPAHGRQPEMAYHGFYRQHMYYPLLVFDGTTGQLITAVLRPGNVHGSRFVVLVLRRLLKRLRAAWPAIAVEIRADRGFAVPRLDAWCEHHDVTYTIGLVPNRRLVVLAAPLLAQALAECAARGGAKVRLAGETAYQAKSWPQPRRVVYKAEALAKGPNTRFVVTTRSAAPLAVYDWYVDRGTPENWIKDFKNALQADHLHDHRFWANQFRLLLHVAAYWLLDTLRRWLVHRIGAAAHIQLDTLRLRLLKIGGRIREHGLAAAAR